ncbi:unnamed protein product, partial [Rotaria magnacalcarata]
MHISSQRKEARSYNRKEKKQLTTTIIKPIKPFSITEDDEENEYEVTSIKETPCVANGMITPRQHMTLQGANLTERTIIIYKNQPLATMTRLNQTQINMVQHGMISSTTKQTISTA